MTTTPIPALVSAPELELMVRASPALPVIHLEQLGPRVTRMHVVYRDVTCLCRPGEPTACLASAPWLRPASPERIAEVLEDARMCRACAGAYHRLANTAMTPDGAGTDSLLALLDQEDPS